MSSRYYKELSKKQAPIVPIPADFERTEPIEYKDTNCFDMVAAAIEHIFRNLESSNLKGHKLIEEIEASTKFFNSQLAHAWCDCSNNFNQERLLKKYKELANKKIRAM